jgi:hypothetical protein
VALERVWETLGDSPQICLLAAWCVHLPIKTQAFPACSLASLPDGAWWHAPAPWSAAGMFILQGTGTRITLNLDRIARCATLCVDPYPYRVNKHGKVIFLSEKEGTVITPMCHNETDPTNGIRGQTKQYDRLLKLGEESVHRLPPYLLSHPEQFPSYFHYVPGGFSGFTDAISQQ